MLEFVAWYRAGPVRIFDPRECTLWFRYDWEIPCSCSISKRSWLVLSGQLPNVQDPLMFTLMPTLLQYTPAWYRARILFLFSQLWLPYNELWVPSFHQSQCILINRQCHFDSCARFAGCWRWSIEGWGHPTGCIDCGRRRSRDKKEPEAWFQRTHSESVVYSWHHQESNADSLVPYGCAPTREQQMTKGIPWMSRMILKRRGTSTGSKDMRSLKHS